MRQCGSLLHPNPQSLYSTPNTHSQLFVPASTTQPTRPRTASWLCGILATANRASVDFPWRATLRLDNRILPNEDDGNDFSSSLPSPSACNLIFFFFMGGCTGAPQKKVGFNHHLNYFIWGTRGTRHLTDMTHFILAWSWPGLLRTGHPISNLLP